MKPFCFNGAKVGIIFELCNFSAIIFTDFRKIAEKSPHNHTRNHRDRDGAIGS